MGKGEIARYEQFLLFPQCFQKAYIPGASKGVIEWEWVKMSSAICFTLDHSKILSSGNGLRVHADSISLLKRLFQYALIGCPNEYHHKLFSFA